MKGIECLCSMQEKIEFAEIMSDPDRKGMSIPQIANHFKISEATIYNKISDREIQNLIKSRRSDRVKLVLPEIDRALMKKALLGDIKAIALLFERWDNYIPKQRNEIIADVTEEIGSRKEKVKARLNELLNAVSKGTLQPITNKSEETNQSNK